MRILYAVASLLLVGMVCAAVWYAGRRGIAPPDYGDRGSAVEVVQSLRGEYPPGPALVYYGARRFFGVGPLALNGVFALGVGAALAMLARGSAPAGRDGRLAGLVALCLLVLNAYGVWLMLTSRDTGLHNLFFLWGAVAWVGLGRARRRAARVVAWVGVCVLPSVAGLMRVTSFATWFCMLGAASLRRKRAWAPLGVVVVAALLYAGANYAGYGRFSLSTTTGANLFLGQHPYYLSVHPWHDIEALTPFYEGALVDIRREKGEGTPSIAEVDAGLGARARGFVRDDPGGAAGRVVLKACWYFLNPAKIPVFTDLDPARVGWDGTVETGRRDLRMTFVYLPYGLVFVALFWGSLVHHARRGDFDVLVLYVPFFAMALLGMLLFPDTRFRQAAELLTYAPISHAVVGWLRRLG